MNRKSQNEPFAKLARTYGDAIDVPPFDRQAIERRSPRSRRVATLPWWRQYAFAAVTAIVLVAWAAPAFPALIADVQNAMQLFLERNGQMTPATDREATIAQAARDLPFRVIPPSGVPLTVQPMIREISVAGDPGSAQLLIQYSQGVAGPKPGFTALPALTIVETAASSPPANLAITVHPVGTTALARPPAGEPPRGAMQVRALTEIWVQNGTRVRLLGTPGAITQAQLQEIRHAMGG